MKMAYFSKTVESFSAGVHAKYTVHCTPNVLLHFRKMPLIIDANESGECFMHGILLCMPRNQSYRLWSTIF